jgi:choline dehydrogenase-like flavoprotein
MAAQLALYECRTPASPPRPTRMTRVPMCASCRAREARYGFRSQLDDPLVDRPRTLCFECFRVEMARRQDSARAVQVRLPLERTLEALHLRRRRAQIAARRAVGIR